MARLAIHTIVCTVHEGFNSSTSIILQEYLGVHWRLQVKYILVRHLYYWNRSYFYWNRSYFYWNRSDFYWSRRYLYCNRS
jgi:hypothetical protein